jgi:hypothetical protein
MLYERGREGERERGREGGREEGRKGGRELYLKLYLSKMGVQNGCPNLVSKSSKKS